MNLGSIVRVAFELPAASFNTLKAARALSEIRALAGLFIVVGLRCLFGQLEPRVGHLQQHRLVVRTGRHLSNANALGSKLSVAIGCRHIPPTPDFRKPIASTHGMPSRSRMAPRGVMRMEPIVSVNVGPPHSQLRGY